MVWNFAQGIVTAIQGVFAPQTVVAMTQRQNEIDRIDSQFLLQERQQEFQAEIEGYRIASQFRLQERQQGFQGVLETLKIDAQFAMQAKGQEFQAELEGVRQKFNREVEEYRQFCENARLENRQDFEREQLARRLQHEQRLEEYRRETQLILSRVQLDAQLAMQTRGQEFQAALEGVRQKFNREVEEYRQFSENARLQKRQNFESEQLTRRLQHEQRLEEYRRETQLILSRAQLVTAIELADDKQIRDSFPLKTPARVILDAYKGYQESFNRIPLMVIISPPALEFEKFPNAAQGFSRIEARLTDEVQEFCKHYSLTSQERPVRYQGADWESKSSHGKSAVDVLHHVLKSVPTVVLESKVDGDLLRIYLAGWDILEKVPHYEKVLTVPWKEVLYPIARQYAEKWRKYRMVLLEKGKSIEDIKRRGGDDEVNLLILEEEEEDRECGFNDTCDYKYNVKEEKYIQELAQFLGICHCTLVGLMADRYHFFHSDVRPKLPELLPGLLEKVPNESLKQMLVGEIVSSYEILYQLVGVERPNAIPYLFLDLALSLSFLSDKSWARKQVEFSLLSWLKLRNPVSEEKTSFLEILDAFTSALTVADKEYVEKLSGCLAAIGESQHQEKILGAIEEAKRKRQLENASVACTLTGHSEIVLSLAISPDGQTLVSSSGDNTIKLWQLSTGRELRTLSGHSDPLLSLAISPDGQTLVSSSGDNRIKIWQLNTGQELRTLSGHSEIVLSLAISPDGQTLVSSSEDKTIKIWQLSTGRELRTLTGHSEIVFSLTISPDGQTLVSGSEDGTIKIWRVA